MSTSNENIGELLRSVDKVIKTGDLEEAVQLVDKILKINPKNIYAKAYSERIDTLIKEKKEKESKAPVPVQNVQQAQPAQPPPPPKVVAAPVAQSIPTKYERKLSDAILEAYKTLLNEIWKDGYISPLEQERLNSMREFFGVSQDEHDYLDQNSRLTCYLNAIKDAWQKGVREFSGKRKEFKITDDEELILQQKKDRLLKSLESKGVILSLDDDRSFLLIIEKLLEKHGYHSLNTTSGEEALNLLEHFTPDLVLCDIAFGQQNMNGFVFYEKFRSIEKFVSVPFIFISGLNQKDMIRTGKKIGVDDYITKPFDNDVLIATIEGRIRRARELKKASDY